MKIREEKLEKIIHWAENNPDIRAVLLTSSLVNPYAPVDDFSDLDVELVFDRRQPYEINNEWLSLFGEPISMVEEDDTVFDGKHAMKMVLYKDHVKVDFKLYQISEFIEEIQQENLPDDWDVGYKVLIDKDGLTKDMKSPTYQSVMIRKPSEKKFKQLLNDFWWDTTYVAKCLKRGDIFYAKFMSENILRTDYLVPLTEWYIAAASDWNTVTTNKHGRLFKNTLQLIFGIGWKLHFQGVISKKTGPLYGLMLTWCMNWAHHWQKSSVLNTLIPMKMISGLTSKKYSQYLK